MRPIRLNREEAVQTAKRALSLAASNLLQHRARLYVAIAGIGVAIFLLLMQIAFLHGVRVEATRLYDDFDFDLAVVPVTYQFLYSGGAFDRVRLMQAQADKDVTEAFGLNIGVSRWTDEDTQLRSSILLIGIDEPGDFVADSDIRNGYAALAGSRAVLIDAWSASGYGPLALGREAQISDQPVDIAGFFKLGLFFYADGSAILRNPDFARLTGHDASQVSVGFLKLAPGADADAAQRRLSQSLPKDVRVFTRAQLIAQERSFFTSTKPIGVLMRVSMIIAFLVGATILFQVLSAEIIQRAKEFAVLKAMGFPPEFVFGVGLAEILLLAFAAFVPALVLAVIVLGGIEFATKLPTGLTFTIAIETLFIVLAMGIASGLSVIGRIARADPAELFK
ncbi:MAG TPA: ABC transporter permease [Rhizomicrobium sp.]|nr:ABC transporter permease [Rhizomicrobium sp.]